MLPVGRDRRELLCLAGAVRAYLVDVAAGAGPCRIHDPLTVRTPRRLELADSAVRETLGCPAWIVHHVEAVERDERELSAVRRRCRVADLLDDERRRIRNRILETNRGAEWLDHVRR